MVPSLDGALERQPLLELQQHGAEVASIAADTAAPPAAAGLPPDSAGAASDPATGTAAQPPTAAHVQRLLSEKRCRYCLQEEEPGSQLEAPCKCAGSIKVCGLAGNVDWPLGLGVVQAASQLAGHCHSASSSIAHLPACSSCSGRTMPACSDGWTRSTTSAGALPNLPCGMPDCPRAAQCQGVMAAGASLPYASNLLWVEMQPHEHR